MHALKPPMAKAEPGQTLDSGALVGNISAWLTRPPDEADPGPERPSSAAGFARPSASLTTARRRAADACYAPQFSLSRSYRLPKAM